MEVEITRTFFSKSQNRIVNKGETLNCNKTVGEAIIQSKLGEEVATTKDMPIAPNKPKRKTKRVLNKNIETAAAEIEAD